MNYFKNVELAQKYSVSESTVRNWVRMAKQGKLELVLSAASGRLYVANSPSNMPIIDKLVEENRKYRNSLAAKSIAPRPQFYEVFTQSQIYDIVRNLEIHHEVSRQYNYFDGGADKWAEYVERLASENESNLLNRTTGLITENQSYLDRRLAKYKCVNVVDIGVGNALPAKELLSHLLEQGVLGRYIAIDISAEMLEIAKRNIKGWFGDRVIFEGHQMDITYERFAGILTKDYLKKRGRDSTNLILFLGGTADNLRSPDDAFRTINESMNPSDLLLYTNKLETEEMRPQWFDYTAKPGKLSLAPTHRLVFDLLNIDESLYDVEMGFDAQTRQRYTRTRLKLALKLKFDFDDGERTIEFEKGDTILLWRSWQMTAPDVAAQFDRNGFYALHSSQTEDRKYIMTLAEVE
jgi:uncharacterized SAM-dependent methyltransferase/transposase